MAEGFLESIGTAELIKLKYDEGYAAGQNAATSTLKIAYMQGPLGWNPYPYGRWDDVRSNPTSYTASFSIGTSKSVTAMLILAYNYTGGAIAHTSYVALSGPSTLSSSGSMSVATNHISISLYRSGASCSASLKAKRYDYDASSGSWQINALQALIYC